MKNVRNELVKIVAEHFGSAPEEIQDESILEQDFFADSLDIVELFMKIEKQFDIPISDQAAEKIRTFGDLVALVEKKVL